MHGYMDWSCKDDNKANTLATLFFNTEVECIKILFSSNGMFFLERDLIIFAIIWYLITIVTYGVSVPSGIFLPGIIVGASLGKWYSYAFSKIFDDESYFKDEKYM
jgi:chloride channel 7